MYIDVHFCFKKKLTKYHILKLVLYIFIKLFKQNESGPIPEEFNLFRTK